jgi:hypothetical protein
VGKKSNLPQITQINAEHNTKKAEFHLFNPLNPPNGGLWKAFNPLNRVVGNY